MVAATVRFHMLPKGARQHEIDPTDVIQPPDTIYADAERKRVGRTVMRAFSAALGVCANGRGRYMDKVLARDDHRLFVIPKNRCLPGR